MKALILMMSILAVTASGQSAALSSGDLVGTWNLVSVTAVSAKGESNNAPFGASPKGVITYTSDGRMTCLVSYDGRKPLSADRVAAPAAERAQAFATFFAYAGRYSVEGSRIRHHVEISSVQNWVGTDLVREAKIEGGRLTIRTPPVAAGGALSTNELIFERAK
jgi:hypothetical protein